MAQHQSRLHSTPTRAALVLGSDAGQGEHSVERHAGPVGGLSVDGDLLYDVAGHQVLQGPDQVRQVDSVHRRAETHVAVEEHHRLVRVLDGETAYEVQLRAHRER